MNDAKTIGLFIKELRNEKGLSQEEFASSVAKSNPVLGQYLTNIGKGNASLTGYIGQLVTAKAATLGLQVATTALNMAITMGISWAISKLISGIDYLINRNEKLAESAEEAAQKAKEKTDEIKEEKSSLSELIKEYKKSNFPLLWYVCDIVLSS